MLYLRPVGGLCNRLRTIDSFIDICVSKGIDLTIFWTMDDSLNSSFEDIFEPLNNEHIVINLMNVPVNFPELNLIKMGEKEDSSYKVDLVKKEGFLKANIKALSANLKLNDNEKATLNKLKKIPHFQILTNPEFGYIYNNILNNSYSTQEIESLFISNVSKLIDSVLDNLKDAYIDCCYRVSELKSLYKYIKPVESLQNRIFTIAKQFDDNTLGLHIRKTDHIIAQSVSTDEKFFSIIEKAILQNTGVRFFLSTDDLKTKLILEKKYGERIISAPVTSFDRNNNEAIKDAVVDLYCLSNTAKIFGSHHSSFSQTAAQIGGIENAVVE